MKKLVLCAALATLVAVAAPTTAAAVDNGPPAALVASVISLDHATESFVYDAQYALATASDLQAPATATIKNGDYYLEQTAYSATRGAPEVAVLTDTYMIDGSGVYSASYNFGDDSYDIGGGARPSAVRLWHDPGDMSADAMRAQAS